MFLSKLHGPFRNTLSRSLLVEKRNKKRFLLSCCVSTGFRSFHAPIIVLVKALELKLLSVHRLPAKVRWNVSSPHISSPSTVIPSSSFFDRGISFDFSIASNKIRLTQNRTQSE